MNQQSLIYSFVARGTVILAEYDNINFIGNYDEVAAKCLQYLPSPMNNLAYNCNGYTFSYLADSKFIESAGLQIPITFLERIQEDFTKKYARETAEYAAAKSLNREFGATLEKQMQYCIDHREEIDKLVEVSDFPMENLEKILDNKEKIELEVEPHFPMWYDYCTTMEKLKRIGLVLVMAALIVIYAAFPGFDYKSIWKMLTCTLRAYVMEF